MSITRHLLLGMTALVCGLAAAQDGRSGEAVYRDVCLTCHAGKVDKAPQFADRAAWKPLLAEGQAVLTGHAWVGVRGMPAQGGRPDLTLPEFSRATAYMARAAGGNWPDPDARMLTLIENEVVKRRAQLKAKAGG